MDSSVNRTSAPQDINAQHPLLEGIYGINKLLDDPAHTPDQVHQLIDDLMQRLSQGNIEFKATIERCIIDEHRALINKALKHSSLTVDQTRAAQVANLEHALTDLQKKDAPSTDAFDRLFAPPSGPSSAPTSPSTISPPSSPSAATSNPSSSAPIEADPDVVDAVKPSLLRKVKRGAHSLLKEETDSESVQPTLTSPKLAVKRAARGVASGVELAGDKLEEHQERRAGRKKEAQERTEREAKAFDAVKEFLAPGMEEDKYAKILGKVLCDYKSESRTTELKQFLNAEIRQVHGIVGADSKEHQQLVADVHAENDLATKNRIHGFEKEIRGFQTAIKKLESQKAPLEQQLKPAERETAAAVTARGNLTDQINGFLDKISEFGDEIEKKQEEIRIAKEAAATKNSARTRVTGQTLLIYVHRFFDPNKDFKQAQVKASENIKQYEAREENEGKVGIRGRMDVTDVAAFIADQMVPDWSFVPEAARSKVIKSFRTLTELGVLERRKPPQSKINQLLQGLDKSLDSITDRTEREKVLQQVVTHTIATIHRSTEAKFYQRGLSRTHFRAALSLADSLRLAYEQRIDSQLKKEGTYGLSPEQVGLEFLKRSEAFHRSIYEVQLDNDLADRLRDHHSQNAYSDRAARWLAGKGLKFGKYAGGQLGKGAFFVGKKGMEGGWNGIKGLWKYGAEKAKANPGGAAKLAALGTVAALATPFAALLVYAGGKGLGWGYGKLAAKAA